MAKKIDAQGALHDERGRYDEKPAAAAAGWATTLSRTPDSAHEQFEAHRREVRELALGIIDQEIARRRRELEDKSAEVTLSVDDRHLPEGVRFALEQLRAEQATASPPNPVLGGPRNLSITPSLEKWGADDWSDFRYGCSQNMIGPREGADLGALEKAARDADESATACREAIIADAEDILRDRDPGEIEWDASTDEIWATSRHGEPIQLSEDDADVLSGHAYLLADPDLARRAGEEPSSRLMLGTFRQETALFDFGDLDPQPEVSAAAEPPKKAAPLKAKMTPRAKPSRPRVARAGRERF